MHIFVNMFTQVRKGTYILIYLIVFLSTYSVSGQKYGNEWIDTSKVHVKFAVANDGIYRLGYFAVEALFTDAGQFLSTIPFSQFRLYNMGNEVPIFVNDQNNNNIFDPFDFVEFVGHKADGKFDAGLYSNPEDQRHTLQSIISDSNHYFFTHRTTGVGLRYKIYKNTNPPNTPAKAYHISESQFLNTKSYHSGIPFSLANQLVYLSEYSSGEGFVGDDILGNSDTNAIQYKIALATPHPYVGAVTGSIEIGLIGASVNSINYNHRVICKIGPSESQTRSIFDTSWLAHGRVIKKLTVLNSDLGNTTWLLFNSRFINNINYSLIKHSHTVVNYPKLYHFGDSIKYSYIEDSSSMPVNIEWTDYGDGFFSLPIVYDEINYNKIIGDYTVGQRKVSYTLPAMASPGKMFIHDEGKIIEIYNDQCRGVRMKDFSKQINKFNQYIIITSQELYEGPKEEVKNYAKTWTSRYNVTLSIIEDLYNSYSYGIPHPLAIRNYCRYLLEKSTTNKPKYLLLVGRGFDLSYNRGSAYSVLKPHISRNHIPAMGSPVSDMMFTSGLDGAKQEPAIPTGRIPADVEEDVGNYLKKLQGYLNSYNNYEDWQKRIIHLSGGATSMQALVIKNKMISLEKYPHRNPFAGAVHSYSKSAGGSVDINFRTAIQNEINSGVNLVSFLGHGSNSVTDIDVGDPNDFLNENKYPICYFNGCQVGNPCLPLYPHEAGLSEKMFRAKNKGAVAFIGQTATTELYTVASQMEYFYRAYFDSVEDKSIGNVLKKTIETFQLSNNVLNRLHCQLLFLQGDPALPIYSPTLPDFEITSAGMFLDPVNTIALQDSFRVGIIIKNLGKGVNDSFDINLARIYPDASTKRNYALRWRMHGFEDTAYIVIKSNDKASAGDNVFSVSINDKKNPQEFNYNNNFITRRIYIPANGINLVMPVRFAIIGTDSVDLVVQKSDLFKESEDFYVEIDTTPWFNSPILQSLERDNKPMTAGVIAKWRVKLPSVRDTQVYFWRARINVPATEGGFWTMNSFTYIKNHSEGWMQNLHWQYQEGVSRNQFDDLTIDSVDFGLKYSRIVKKIYIDCQYRSTSNKGVKETGFSGQDLNYGVCTDGIVAITWDGKTLERSPVNISKVVPNCEWGSKWTTFGHFENYQLYYSFDLLNVSDQQRFIDFIDAMDDSMYVTFYTRNTITPSLWKPEVLQALNKVGCTVFDTASWRVGDEIWVALGRKGWKPGHAAEVVAHGPISPYIQLEAEMVGDANKGSMTSELIGPTNSFGELIYRPILNAKNAETNDLLYLNVLGLRPDGNFDVLRKDLTVQKESLVNIYTPTYKFIKLQVKSEDNVKRTSPNLLNWRVVHDSVPEGTLYPEASAGFIFHEDTLYEGDTFRLNLPFKNISKTAFRGSILVQYSISNKVTRQILNQGEIRFPALKADSLFYFTYKMPTTGLSGPFGLQITVNPQYDQPEKTLVNNSSLINFYITKDVMNPILDVTFDGRHILNGDIVSTNPLISISSKDENKFLLQKDTSTFDLFIKKPGTGVFELVKFGSEAIFYSAKDKNNQARIEYNPKDLASGVYTLQVQSRDAKLNQAGNLDYEIDFNVIREQSITHFYPYPNPFSTNMRFVFTLTGSEVPEEILVKIMTTDGRVVKELRKEDLGEIYIGNNITEWAWDGTDQYGDKLGNGTYFYKVSVKSQGEELKLRDSKGDGSFKDQVGVIYLLR